MSHTRPANVTAPLTPESSRSGQYNTHRCSDQGPLQLRQPRNAFERAILKLKLPQESIPDSCFPTDEELDRMFLNLGFSPQTLPELRKGYHASWDKKFADAKRDTLDTLGFKPTKGELVHVVQIPNSPLSIRLWDGGIEAQGQYCLDFINTQTGKATNSPEGWRLHPRYPNDSPFHNRSLISWEEAWHIKKEDIRPGQERFSIIQGAWCGLERPGEEVFWFAVPGRRLPAGVNQMMQTVAQG